MLTTIFIAILAINILVLAHELGHFIMAKVRGISVEVFSIGFGPKIFGFKLKDTEYKISPFLFGGYVKFKGDEIDEITKKVPGGFYTASPFNRILVCVAGGFFNIILACLLYTVIFIQGKPVTEDSLNTIVGGLKEGSAAEKIGIIAEDRILKINQKPVNTFEELVYAIAFTEKDEITVEIERNGEIITKSGRLIPDKETGVKMLGVYPKETIIVDGVLENSPAEKSGLMSQDEIIAINDKKITRLEQLIQMIRDNENKEIVLVILREGKELKIKTIPQKMKGNEYATIGFAPGTRWTVIYPKPWEQFWGDLVRTWMTLSGLITRHIPIKAISGPVGIIGIIGISMHVGWVPLLSIIALISLNLGIVNLLPIPVLDGGHILFNLLEIIRKKPLSMKAIMRIQNVFTALLVLLALYVTYNDILRLFK